MATVLDGPEQFAKGGTWLEDDHPRGQPDNAGEFTLKRDKVTQPKQPKFEDLGGQQQALFSTSGLAGQMNLFKQPGVPDEMLPKELRGQQESPKPTPDSPWKVGQKVSVSGGAPMHVMAINPNGTLTVSPSGKQEESFETEPGESIRDATPVKREDSAAIPAGASRDQFIAQELKHKQQSRQGALKDIQSEITQQWKPKNLPVGLSAVQHFLTQERVPKEFKDLRVRYRIALKNLESDTAADEAHFGRVYDAMQQKTSPPPIALPKAAGKPPEPQKEPAEKPKPGMLFSKRYAKEGEAAKTKGGWVMLGESPVFLDDEGKIIKGCPGLIGQHIDSLDETQDERAQDQQQAEAQGWTSAKSDRARETHEQFKGQHPDHEHFIGLVRHGGKFHSFGDDAAKLQQHLGIGDGQTAEFDESALPHHMERLVEGGHRVAIIDREEDGQANLDSDADPEAQQAVAEAHEDRAEDQNLVGPDEHPGNGNIVTDKEGNEWLVMKARHGYVEGAPIINGRAVVNANSLRQFNVKPRMDEQVEPLRKTGRNYYEEQKQAQQPQQPGQPDKQPDISGTSNQAPELQTPASQGITTPDDGQQSGQSGGQLAGQRAPQQGDSTPRVTSEEWLSGDWDMAHSGLASEAIQAKIADGMKGIEGREYAIREHSPGKWQLISKPGKKAEPTSQTGDTSQKPKLKGFTTAQGSTYQVDEQGRTTRTKAEHVGHERGDVGLKDRSDKTHFVSAEDAQRIGMHNSMDKSFKPTTLIRGNQALLLSWNAKENRWGKHGEPITLSDSPEVGAAPLELWGLQHDQKLNGLVASKSHPGSPITDLQHEEAATADPAQQPSTSEPPAKKELDRDLGDDELSMREYMRNWNHVMEDPDKASDTNVNRAMGAGQHLQRHHDWLVKNGEMTPEQRDLHNQGIQSEIDNLHRIDVARRNGELPSIPHEHEEERIARKAVEENRNIWDVMREFGLNRQEQRNAWNTITKGNLLNKYRAKTGKASSPARARAQEARRAKDAAAAQQPSDEDHAENWNRATQQQPASSLSDQELQHAINFGQHLQGQHQESHGRGDITPDQHASLQEMIGGHLTRLQSELDSRKGSHGPDHEREPGASAGQTDSGPSDPASSGNAAEVPVAPPPAGAGNIPETERAGAPPEPAGQPLAPDQQWQPPAVAQDLPTRHQTAGEHIEKASPQVQSLLKSLHPLRDVRKTGSVQTKQLHDSYAREMYDHFRGIQTQGDGFGDVHDLSEELGHGAIGYSSPAGNVVMIPPKFQNQEWDVRYTLPQPDQQPIEPGQADAGRMPDASAPDQPDAQVSTDQPDAARGDSWEPDESEEIPEHNPWDDPPVEGKNSPSDPPAPPLTAKPKKARGVNPNTRLGRAVVSAVGEDPADQEGFRDLLYQIHGEEDQRRRGNNDALRNLLSSFGFEGRDIGAFVRAVQHINKKGGDVESAKKGRSNAQRRIAQKWDQMVDFAQKYHPELIESGFGESDTGDPEHGLWQRLQRGLEPDVQPYDDEIVNKALEYLSGSEKSRREEAERMQDPEYAAEQERIRSTPFARQGWKERYSKWCRSTLDRWYKYGKQMAFDWGDEQEKMHPRDDDGRWTDKEDSHGRRGTERTGSSDQPVSEAEKTPAGERSAGDDFDQHWSTPDEWPAAERERFNTAIGGLSSGAREWMRDKKPTIRYTTKQEVEEFPPHLKGAFQSAAAICWNHSRIHIIEGKEVSKPVLQHELVHMAWHNIPPSVRKEASQRCIEDGRKIITLIRKKTHPSEEATGVGEWEYKHLRRTVNDAKKAEDKQFMLELSLMIPDTTLRKIGKHVGIAVDDAQYATIAVHLAMAADGGWLDQLDGAYKEEEPAAYRAMVDDEYADKLFAHHYPKDRKYRPQLSRWATQRGEDIYHIEDQNGHNPSVGGGLPISAKSWQEAVALADKHNGSVEKYFKVRYGNRWQYHYARQLGFKFDEDEHPRAKEKVTIEGKPFTPGEFIPKDTAEEATPAQAEKIEVVDKNTGEAKPLEQEPTAKPPEEGYDREAWLRGENATTQKGISGFEKTEDKPAWTMTRADWHKSQKGKPGYDVMAANRVHKQAVAEAIQQGQEVPPEAYRDYSDLAELARQKREAPKESEPEKPAESEPVAPPAAEDQPKDESAAPEDKSLVRHAIDVPKDGIFASVRKRTMFGAPGISVKSLEGANTIWHQQGDPMQVMFNAGQKDAPEWATKKAAEMKAAQDAGYRFKNYRAGKYGTLYVLEKDGRVLTERGAQALVSGTGKIDVGEQHGRETAKPVIDAVHKFIASLPESTQQNMGALVTALNRSPLGHHVTLARDDNGHLRLSDKQGTWHVHEPTSGHDAEGNWIDHLDSSLPRFLAKLEHMAGNEIGPEHNDWVMHDRAADQHAVSESMKPTASDESPASEAAPTGEESEPAESAPESEPESTPESTPESDAETSLGSEEQSAAQPEAPVATSRQQADLLAKDEFGSDEYQFARQSTVGNLGEDVSGSARHKVNAWKGSLEESEANGTAQEHVTRDKLLKSEPHGLASHVEDNPLSALAMHYALKSFPAKPGYGKYYKPSPEDAKKDRKDYLESYRQIKDKAEEIAELQSDPVQAAQSLKQFVTDTITNLRNRKIHNPVSGIEMSDRYNATANSLVQLSKRLSNYHLTTNHVLNQTSQFAKAYKDKYGEEIDRQKAADHALDIMEGDSLNKTFGREGQKRDTSFSPAQQYVQIAERIGGPPVTAQSMQELSDVLMNKMKMRAVQWGNSVSDDERQHHLTKATEALVDLADVMQLPMENISGNGQLALAIGARGHGSALAHYEPGLRIINLTRKKGVGSLAHEFGHFFDHYLGGMKSGHFLSKDKPVISAEYDEDGKVKRDANGKVVYSEKKPDDPVWHGMHEVRGAWEQSGYEKRLHELLQEYVKKGQMKETPAASGWGMGFSTTGYWKSAEEMFARTFERFVQRKLEQSGRKNTYLAGIETRAYKQGGLWPTDDEVDKMAPAFEKLLDSVRTKSQ